MMGKMVSGRDADVLPQVFLILGFTLASSCWLLQPLPGAFAASCFQENEEKAVQLQKLRDGINLGALLMFLKKTYKKKNRGGQ